jgi:hypothetical protein
VAPVLERLGLDDQDVLVRERPTELAGLDRPPDRLDGAHDAPPLLACRLPTVHSWGLGYRRAPDPSNKTSLEPASASNRGSVGLERRLPQRQACNSAAESNRRRGAAIRGWPRLVQLSAREREAKEVNDPASRSCA